MDYIDYIFLALIIISLVATVTLFIWWKKSSVVILSNREFGIVFDKLYNFKRFVGPGKQTINPFSEQIYFSTLKSQSCKGNFVDLRTAEGINFTISYKITFSINFQKISSEKLASISNVLAQGIECNLIVGALHRNLRNIAEKKPLQELYGMGALSQIEGETLPALREELEPYGLFINMPFCQLGPVTLPKEVENFLVKYVVGERTDADFDSLVQDISNFPPENNSGQQPNQKNNTQAILVLINLMDQSFSQDELIEICLQLGLDFENFRGEGKRATIRNIVMHSNRTASLKQLITLFTELRPNMDVDLLISDFLD